MGDKVPNPNQNNPSQHSAAVGNSVENVDIDIIDSDDDDDDYHPGLVADPLPLWAPLLGIGPHRVQSRDRIPILPFRDASRGRFIQNYRVMSARHLELRGHTNLESGGKVILPPGALEILSRNSSALMRPMMFKATNQTNQKFTHCGVLEFIAEELTCYMPTWMMELLQLNDNDMIKLERVELPTATFAVFQAQSVDFLEITDQRAILENTLRRFSCLTKGDMVSIHYNSRVYKLRVLELLPQDAVTIIECDMNVDFAAPVGYVSPSASNMSTNEDPTSAEVAAASAFVGQGFRLNGKSIEGPSTSAGKANKGNAVDTEWKIGSLVFKRKFKSSNYQSGHGPTKLTAFSGTGLSLRNKKDGKTEE